MNRLVIFCALVFVCALVYVEPALAGPGGKIASAMFETFWGRVALLALTIILSPLIAYMYVREWLSERRARKDLLFMAAYSPQFDWLKILERTKNCFFRVHRSWEDEDLSDCAEWMTDWYWQNQQLVHLNRWKREGLINVCDLKKIKHVRPLLFVHRNHRHEHEDSMLVIAIEAHMSDYLQKRAGGAIVEGSKRYKDVETVWTFCFENGAWKVSNIEDGTMTLAYAKLVKGLPAIESTLVSELRA